MITGVFTMANVTALDVAVPQALVVTTVIEAVPAVAMRAAGTVALSCVADTNVVANGAPFQFTVETDT